MPATTITDSGNGKTRRAGRPRARADAAQPAGHDPFARAAMAFARVAPAIERAADIDDLLRVIARQACELVGVERCSVALLSDATGLFHGRIGLDGDRCLDADVKRARCGIPADAMTTEVAETKRPVVVANARSDSRIMKSTVRFWNIRSMMAVPLVYEDDVIAVVYLDDHDRVHVFTDRDVEVAAEFGRLAGVALREFQAKMDLRSMVDGGEREIKALRRAMAVHEHLSDLVVAGCGLHEMVQALAKLIAKPCSVHDTRNVQLAVACAPGADDGIVPRLLDSPAGDTDVVRRALTANANSRAFLVGPFPEADIPRRYLVAPITVDGELWGRLVVMEHRSCFTGGDMLTIRRAAALLALQVGTEWRASEDQLDAGASLVAELLGGYSDTAAARRRAGRLGVRLDRPHFVVLLASRTRADARTAGFSAALAAMQTVAPEVKAHAAVLEGATALLVELPQDLAGHDFPEWSKDLARGLVEEVAPDGTTIAGVSSLAHDPSDYPEIYGEAQQVVECIRRYGRNGGPAVVSTSDLGAGRIFLATSDAHVVEKFAEASLGELTLEPTKGELLLTLCSFFENLASIRRCALELGVHENTIRYRLGRIEELTGLPVTHDPDGQVRARLSLLILMLQGRVPETMPATEGAQV